MLTLKLRTIQRSIVALGFLAFASALAAVPAAQATRLLRTPTVSATQIALWYRPRTNLQVWVLDVGTGKAKVVSSDPWVVSQRTPAPAWSPDSKWVACASRLESLHRAILVRNVDTGETKQVTDGLADAMYPVFDASGKYLWFLASTDFGLRSQWLDMTSYDREENFGLYLAALKKGEPSPLLPTEPWSCILPAFVSGTGCRHAPPPRRHSSREIMARFWALRIERPSGVYR